MSSSSTGPALFYNAKQLLEAEKEAINSIVYRKHRRALEKLTKLESLANTSPCTMVEDEFRAFDRFIRSMMSTDPVGALPDVANCTSDEMEINRLHDALTMIQSRVNSLTQAIDSGSKLIVIALSPEGNTAPDLPQIHTRDVIHRLRIIFDELRRFIAEQVSVTDACDSFQELYGSILNSKEHQIPPSE